MREESEGEGEGEGGARGVISEVINIPQTANDAQPGLAAARSLAASRAGALQPEPGTRRPRTGQGWGPRGLHPTRPCERDSQTSLDTHTHTGFLSAHVYSLLNMT